MKKFLLLPLVLVGLVSCKLEQKTGATSDGDSKPDEQVVTLENELSELKKELVEEQNLRLRHRAEQAALLNEMKGMLKEVVDSKKEEPKEVAVAPVVPLKEADDAEKLAAENREAGRVARLKAVGEKLASLTTVSGEEYFDLVINRVTDIGVVFRHRGGVGRVPFTDLSAAWRERFYFDADRAILAQKNERLAQIRYERAADARLAALNEQQDKGADAMSLQRLALAVEGLNTREPASQTVVREQIYVDPPIIVNHSRNYGRETYCPPVVRPQIIRTPSIGLSNVLSPSRPSNYCPTPARPTVQRPTARPTPVRPSISRPTSVRPTTSRPTPVRPSISRPSTSRLR